MTIRRLFKPALAIAALTGLYLLGHLFAGFRSETLSPLSWGLASSVLLIVFLIRIQSQLPVWRLRFAFRQVDSAMLDNHIELCRQFFRALLEFRCRYGEKRFMQHLINRFNLFYGYHNDALLWMNKIVRRIDGDSVPANMIIDSICSGHIGHVYSGCHYGGGLPSAFVRFDEAVYLLVRMDSVEVWSASSRTPVCVFIWDSLQLEPGLHHSHYTSAILSGREKATRKTRQLELRIPSVSADEHQITQASAQDNFEELQSWLAVLMFSANKTSQQDIDLAETKISSLPLASTPRARRAPLDDLLQQMLGSHIDAVFNQATLSIADPEIAQSTIVLCGGLGIITIIDVPLAGIIHYSGEPYWMHIDIASSQRFDNACLTAERCKTALINRLTEVGLDRWPVHSLVVFSHDDAQPELELGRQQMQCDVITVAQLPKWFASQSVDDRIRFTKDEYNDFIVLLDPARLLNEQVKHA